MAKKFIVDNMTVDQILGMPFNELNKFDEREMSRALRTVALAANKRLAKLKKYAQMEDGHYQPAGNKKQIATDALNWATKDGKREKFGVKTVKVPEGSKSTLRNKMYEQIGDIRQFMNMKSSTVTGAVELRKTREKIIFGKTREQAVRNKNRAERETIYRTFDTNSKAMWKAYRRTLELGGRDPHAYIDDSEKIQSYIGKEVVNYEGPLLDEDGNLIESRIDAFGVSGREYELQMYEERTQKAVDDLEKRSGRFRGN